MMNIQLIIFLLIFSYFLSCGNNENPQRIWDKRYVPPMRKLYLDLLSIEEKYIEEKYQVAIIDGVATRWIEIDKAIWDTMVIGKSYNFNKNKDLK